MRIYATGAPQRVIIGGDEAAVRTGTYTLADANRENPEEYQLKTVLTHVDYTINQIYIF